VKKFRSALHFCGPHQKCQLAHPIARKVREGNFRTEMQRSHGPNTRLQHLGEEEKPFGAVTPPIFQNSLFVFPDYDSFVYRDPADDSTHVYSRCTNPTVEIAQKKLADLEGTEGARLFGCGMAAISSTILANVQQGSHVVCVDTCYGPTHKFLAEYLPKFGVSTTFVPGDCTDHLLDAIRPETTLVYLESPGSILFRLQDLTKIGAVCRSKGVATAIDNSYSSPVFQNPHAFGIDYVLHSATKYISGHSDVVAGLVCGSKENIGRLSVNELELITGLIHPQPAWLLMRGVRTLRLRMKHAQETGNALAVWVREQPWVERVRHVGFEDFEQVGLRDTHMRGTSSLFSFEPVNQDESWSRAFANALEVFQLGVSWGGHESLCAPLVMHPMDWSGPRRVIRLYAGLEDWEDLIGDLARAASVADGG
jgi:cystathionine beta-lyase/cystathionine gamma-synthase